MTTTPRLSLVLAFCTAVAGCSGTPEPADGGVPPELSATITWPEGGSPVSGNVTVVVEAEPLGEVLGVEFAFLDGTAPHRFDTDLVPPFESVLDSTLRADGVSVLRVTAVGRQGQTAVDEINLLVDNQMPGLEVLAPVEGEVAFVEDGTLPFVVEASDGSGIETVTMSVDGVAIHDVTAGADDRWEGTVDLGSLEETVGTRLVDMVLEAQATDPFGRSTAASVTIGVARRQRWTAVVPSVVESRVAASPDGTALYVATRAGVVHALDMVDGHEICRTSSSGEGFRGPAVSPDGRAVYFGTSAGLRAVSGAPSCGDLWSVRGTETAQGRPTVDPATGTVFFTTRLLDAGSVYSASPGGSLHWGRGDVGLSRSGPTLVPHRRLVVVSSADHHLHAVEVDEGGMPLDGFAWSAETGGELEASATLFEDRLYVGSDDFNLYCFSAVDGSRIWEAPLPTDRRITTRPAVDSLGFVYVTSRDGSCYRVDQDREVDWSYEVESGISYSSPVIDEGAEVVLFCDTGATGADGLVHSNLHAVDLRSGEASWTVSMDESCEATPLLVDGTVVVGTHSGLVYAFFIDGRAARAVLRPGG